MLQSGIFLDWHFAHDSARHLVDLPMSRILASFIVFQAFGLCNLYIVIGFRQNPGHGEIHQTSCGKCQSRIFGVFSPNSGLEIRLKVSKSNLILSSFARNRMTRNPMHPRTPLQCWSDHIPKTPSFPSPSISFCPLFGGFLIPL